MGDGADDLMFREIGLSNTEFFTGRKNKMTTDNPPIETVRRALNNICINAVGIEANSEGANAASAYCINVEANKALEALDRMQKPVDVEALKQNKTPDFGTDRDEIAYSDGWNYCIDHLNSLGYLIAPEEKTDE